MPINIQYLKETVIKAKEHIEAIRNYLDYGSLELKTRLLLLNLKLLVPLAVFAILGLRTGLNQLSPVHRQAGR